jgi:hypothetical protein
MALLDWLGGPGKWIGDIIVGPVLDKAVDGYKAKLAAGNDKDRIAAELGGRELALQQREAELQTQLRIAQVGKWWEPEKIMGYAVAVYVCKILIWDKVLGLGSTDPLIGWIEVTANLIVGAYFGKRTFENLARIIKK